MPNQCEKIPLRNATNMKFNDISSEAERTYNTSAFTLTIKKPLYLHISPSRGHYILAANGHCYYVRPSDGECSYWLEWIPKRNEPHFVPVIGG